jgi:hypothetical protein
MTQRLLFALLLLLPLFGFSQKLNPRQILHGMVIADSLAVDNLTIKNNTSRISAITDTRGMFTLYARATDTLYFSGIGFRSAYIVVKEDHFLQDPLVIKLNIDVTVLDEVVIKPTVLTGDLAGDSKKVKTKAIASGMTGSYESIKYNIEHHKYDKNQNGALPTQVQGSQLTGVNFVRIYETFFKKRKKKKDKGEIYSLEGSQPFPDAVKSRFTYNFFTQMLQIPKDEIGLFLTFCDTGATSQALLDPKKEFELTDYLVQKSKEYLAQKK